MFIYISDFYFWFRLLVQSLDEPTKMGYVPNNILKKIPSPARATAVVPAEGQTLSKKDAKFNRE